MDYWLPSARKEGERDGGMGGVVAKKLGFHSGVMTIFKILLW